MAQVGAALDDHACRLAAGMGINDRRQRLELHGMDRRFCREWTQNDYAASDALRFLEGGDAAADAEGDGLAAGSLGR